MFENNADVLAALRRRLSQEGLEPSEIVAEAAEEAPAPSPPVTPQTAPEPSQEPASTYRRLDLRWLLTATEVYVACYDQPVFQDGLAEAFRCLCNVMLINDAMYRLERVPGNDDTIRELLAARRQEAVWLRLALSFHGMQSRNTGAVTAH